MAELINYLIGARSSRPKLKHMKNTILILIFTLIASFWSAFSPCSEALAINKAGGADSFGSMLSKEEDPRVLKLKNYLEGYPLEENAKDFIQIAEKYGFKDHPYLVAAIGFLESTGGKFIPPGSYNAWGFGIPTGHQSGIVFNSWKEGIEEVTKTIRKNYLKDKDPEDMTSDELIYFIGPIYAASPTWAQRVSHITNKIEDSPATPSSVASLSIDL